ERRRPSAVRLRQLVRPGPRGPLRAMAGSARERSPAARAQRAARRRARRRRRGAACARGRRGARGQRGAGRSLAGRAGVLRPSVRRVLSAPGRRARAPARRGPRRRGTPARPAPEGLGPHAVRP
ncbi:MAG: Selenoprotein O and cysteine-containing homologs, partial [uncultured Solirubrobacteraceae bacterium]